MTTATSPAEAEKLLTPSLQRYLMQNQNAEVGAIAISERGVIVLIRAKSPKALARALLYAVGVVKAAQSAG